MQLRMENAERAPKNFP